MKLSYIAASLGLLLVSAFGAEKPNIIFILADDLGYGDLSCYSKDSKIPTPNIDKLATGGMLFTDAYCPVSICTPSRYALMAGRYPIRARKKGGVLANWEEPMIEEDRVTLPSIMKQAGYTTAGIGKWHLGATYSTTDSKAPIGQGQFSGKNNGDNIDLKAPIKGGPLDRGFDQWYGFICASERAVFEGNRAVAMMIHPIHESSAVLDAVGLPTMEISEYLPIVTKKTIAFLEEQKSEKPFFLYITPYVPHIPLAVEKKFLCTTKGGEYGDYVHELDHYIGQILDALDRKGISNNTLVMFASDNGSQFEMTGEGHRPNGTLRGTKYAPYEGGLRTPFLARWPGHIPSGSKSSHLLALNDVLATCAAVAGQDLPEGSAEDSLNLLPILLAKSGDKPIREEVVIQSAKMEMGLRQGKWKYIAARKKSPAELYDLSNDPGETTNVVEQYPDVVKAMNAKLEQLLGPDAKPIK